jgi:SAM-dependent methyltransferase
MEMETDVRSPAADAASTRPGRGPALLADQGSLPMVDIYLSMMRASAMAAAGRIGLFEALAKGPMALPALAHEVGAQADGVGRLADFLVAAGFLERRDDLLSNAPETTRWFTSRGAVDYGPGLVWTADAWMIMDDLAGAVRRGGPDRLLWDRMTAKPALGVHFSRYMRAFAEHLSPDLLAAADLRAGPVRLLDLGGSHGVHSMAFCRQSPGLNAVIVDLESALAQTAALIDAQGLKGRVTVRPGDLRDRDWGSNYDIVLYLSVAHNMSLDENRQIFRHLAKVMRPGGQLIIHDYPRETTPAAFETAFRLTLLVETGTRTLTLDEMNGLLTEAGFAAPRITTLSPAEKGALIVARRP